REAILHSQLQHPNILHFLGAHYEQPDSPPLVILPFHEHGSLQNLLADLPVGGLMQVVGSARGVVYLHSRTPPIIHGDLHPGNILLDNAGDPVLCDFGLSRIHHEPSRSHSIREDGGRTRFIAPELHDSSADQFSSTQESDIFALAMTYLNAWSSHPPFSEIKNEYLVTSRYRQGLRPMEPGAVVMLEPRMKTDFWKLITTMWAHDVSKRPSSSTVLEQLEDIFNPCESYWWIQLFLSVWASSQGIFDLLFMLCSKQ
ncbi:kinase-like protein, partial [Clavulina sp. PMI_390]